ncbi:MAG TPA: 30S ribosomal protein S4 [Candidatus Magasanikbacteria bacterium]|nr:30S ribosomal protein S4 [Candidatus Magasanikbacteria bacterium]
MGRNIGPKNKLSRRFGVDLGLKTNPTKVARRLGQMPGVHGPKKKRNSKMSSFGMQLIEKQKAKIIYGLREKQFTRYVKEATKEKGDSGVNLQLMLENRLDNIVYRLGFADTRAQARQFVSHGFFDINGKRNNIPSHICRVGDVISLRENKAKKKLFETITDKLSKKETQSWLSVNPTAKSGKILGKPTNADFEKTFDVKLIIEFYSTR